MQAIIVSIGDELVLGQGVDTNAAWLSERLAGLGVVVVEHVTVGDDFDRLENLLRRVGPEANVVLVTGGLGPTEDDLTRQVVAEVLDKPLVLDEPSLENIRGLFQKRGKEMPERNRIQAMIPEGCGVIENPTGTAAGIKAEMGQSQSFFLPGVPSEMKAMYNESVGPVVRQLAKEQDGSNQVIVSRRLHVLGMSESALAERLGDLMDRGRNPVVNSTVARGIITLRINATAKDRQEAQCLIDPVEKNLYKLLGTHIYGCDDETLAQAVVRLLKQQGKQLSVAESCTGGMISAALTDVAGASDVFGHGWVTYSNIAKQQELDVPAELLEKQGAVSKSVCEVMAENACRLSESDFALAVTGIAGPGGGTESKPVGLVFIGLCDGNSTSVKQFSFSGSREIVRRRTVIAALDLLRHRLL